MEMQEKTFSCSLFTTISFTFFSDKERKIMLCFIYHILFSSPAENKEYKNMFDNFVFRNFAEPFAIIRRQLSCLPEETKKLKKII